MRKLIAFIGIVVVALALAVGAKTALTPSRQLQVASVQPATVDPAAAAGRLAAAVRFKTVSNYDDESANAGEFEALHKHLEASFPKAHAVLKREAIGKFGLLYTWPGSDPKAQPFALMAHQDVVPVAPGTEGDWQQPPFSGEQKDGFVWGRGSWDDKGNLMSMFEAVEMLVAAGFQPRQTIYLVFGHDEEVGGERGAAQAVKLFKERGIQLQFVLDEGLLITDGLLKGIDRPLALVGVAEKGYLSLQMSARTTPGHSSMPPPQPEQSAIGMMSAALTRLEASPMPGAITGLPQEMFETLAPEMSGVNRVLLSNLWLFKPLVQRELQKSASTNAMLRTTTALTIFNAGNKDNVLPGQADAVVNFRLFPGDTTDKVIEHTQKVMAVPGLKVAKGPGWSEPSKVAATDSPAFRLINRTVRQLHPDVIVAPGLMVAATDSRYFDAVSDNVFKFSPVRAKADDLKRFHGTNERISIDNYVELIQFYHQLVRNAASPQPAADAKGA